MNVSYQSASTRLFLESAQELAVRLEQEGSEEARSLAREAREILASFEGWATRRPSDDDRVTTIQKLFDLNRRANDILAA
jgi:hypothetical protein